MIFQHRWKELMLTEKLAHIQDKKNYGFDLRPTVEMFHSYRQ